MTQTQFVSQSVTSDVYINWDSYYVITLETDMSRYNEADLVIATVLPRDPGNEPDMGDDFVLTINDWTVFTGTIQRASYLNDGSYKIRAVDAVRRLKNEDVYLSVTDPTPLSEVVEEVCDQADVDPDIRLPWYTEVDSGPIDYLIGYEASGEPATEILDTLAKWARGVWWVDEWNDVRFGEPNTERIELEYILDTSAGKITPPYQGVKVVGDQAVSAYGWESRYIPSENPVTSKRGLFYDDEYDDWDIRQGTTNNPVFTYKQKLVKTQQQAEALADSLIRELRNQVREGHVTVVGNEKITKLDVIEMPEIMGNEKYYVGRVVHRIDNSNGFTTKVECEGLVPDEYYA